MKIEPQLIDPNWFVKKEPKLLKNPPKLNFTVSHYINFISICVIILGGMFLYDRYLKRDITELEKQNSILQFHQNVKEKLQK